MRNRINRRVLTPVFCLLCGWVLSQETPDLRSRPVSEETKLWNAALEDIGTGRDAHAVPKLEQILMLNPRNYTAWEHLGWCYLRLQREQDTERLWNRLRQIDPTHPAAYKFLAKLAIQQNRLKEAQDLFRKSLDRDPDQPDVVYNLGRSLRWEGQMQRSVDILEPLLKENPDRTDVILELARAKMSQWDFAGALSHWTTLSFLAPPQLDYRANRALCLLHTGNLEEALLLAGEVLALDPLHLIALQTLANAAEMGENPAQALPYLERWMDAQVEEKEKEAVRVRLIRLHVRLYRDQPKIRTLTRAIELSRDRLRWNPNSVDAHLLLGELLLMEQRFSEAEERFLKVLQEYNAENRRAVKGLFETYAASKRYDEAREMLGRLSAFNPLNPYLDFYRARFEAARGDFYEAGLALDRLEAAGLRGSVAILLYHGLVESDYFIDALSVRRFRDHLTALRDAGFRVVRVQDIPDVLDGLSAGTDPSPTDGTGILVAIDFDDARKDSMRFATPIAREFQWPFSMNVPVGYIEMNHPFICSWDELRHYKATGVWSYGSHFLNAAILVPTGPGGQLGRPLPNRVWQPGLQSLESTELYVARLSDEFIQSRVVLERQLGAPVDVISYPFGDIGQEDITNLEGTSLRIVEAGSQTYRVGLIQSEFGYAVHGDNPLLYQRHEMDRWTGGTNLIQHLYASHPVLLARRLRAEFAALAGKRHEARLSLRQLEEARYPEPLLNPVADYVHRRMARKFATPGADDLDDSRSVFELRPDKPYIGGRGSYFEDNQGRRNWQILGLGGFHITPYISMEGKGGIGNLRQDSTEDGRAALDIDETVVGASLNVLLPTGGFITGEALQRDFSEPADAVLARSVEGHFRPFYLTDILLRYEHDIAPSAQAAVEDIQYDALMGLGIFSLRDWWDLSASGMFYDFSDDNTRDHLMLGTTWLLAERTGLKLGLRYMFTTSDFESDAYWTPYRLQRYFIETSLQGNYLRHYYNARIRFGLGREGTRPERIEQRRELEDRARRLRFDPGPPDEKEGWEPVFGLMLSTRLRFGEYWMIHGELSYNRVPNYEELHLLGEIRYSF